jgi:hypothetical protein
LTKRFDIEGELRWEGNIEVWKRLWKKKMLCVDETRVVLPGERLFQFRVPRSDLGCFVENNARRVIVGCTRGRLGSEIVPARDLKIPRVVGPGLPAIIGNKDEQVDTRSPPQHGIADSNKRRDVLTNADL